MRILIAEDDMPSRKFIVKFLSKYGTVDATVDGEEAFEAFLMSLEEENYYDLICLDVMMPKIDGIEVLRRIRDTERERGLEKTKMAKIIMTTALNDSVSVKTAFEIGSQGYASKPINTNNFEKVLVKMGLI